ncbi:hypothetical protein ACIGW3_08625 [Streptomyces sp. NPDC053499]|uniref:hypothetical protein n=1 Tax=Streptomyces sp. NPDC053499 TaxID=3365707 RepID=UPI0037CECBB6
MPARTGPRTVKVPAGASTIRIPRQRRSGRRSDPFVVVVPERPSLTRLALGATADLVWRHRGALAPLGIAVGVFLVATLLHALAWWSGLALVPAAVGPLVWLALVQHRRPAAARAVCWRVAFALLTTAAGAWAALAAGFGPLAGPLEVWWLLTFVAAQTTWLIARHSN